MRLFSHHKARENRIITLFRAIFDTLWRFTSGQHFKLGLYIFCVLTAASLTFAVSLFAKNEKTFNPEEQSLHIFPSYIESATWHNIETLSFQDVQEGGLYQSFDQNNSAYVDPSGKLPELIVETEDDQVGAENDNKIRERVEDVSGSELVEVSATSSVEAGDELLVEEEVVEGEELQESESSVTEVVAEEIPAETETQSGENSGDQGEPESEPEPEPQPEPETEAASDESVSFFKKVTSIFSFATAATTSPTVEETAEETESVSEPEPEAVVEVEENVAESEEVPVEDTAEDQESVLVPTGEVLGEEFASSTDEEVVLDDESTEDFGFETVESATTSTTTSEKTESDTEVSQTEESAVLSTHSITLRDFGVPTLESGQFVNNLQLRLSLGGQYNADASGTIPSLTANYTFGDFAGEAGSILIEDEISNALNGGYYLLPLPSVTDPALLSDLEITLTFEGELERLQGLYLDAVWLEVGTVIYDAKLLEQRYAPGQLKHLSGLSTMEFLGEKLDFTRDELPQFSMRYNSQRNFAVRAVRGMLGRDLAVLESVKVLHASGRLIAVDPTVNVTSDGLISIVFTEDDKALLPPGEYTVEMEINEGGVMVSDSFSFQWGLLAINTDQTEYKRNSVVTATMGALSPNGNTVCSAILNLYVTDPRGYISRVPVVESGACHGNNVTDIPDYSAQFVADHTGEYQLYLERSDAEGNVLSHTESSFTVVLKQDVFLSREGPTRIYPPAPYAMEISVHNNRGAFDGELIERVPRGFKIKNTDAEIRPYADFVELAWHVSILGSTTKTYSYEFDAPDLSPFLYELGPAQLIDEDYSEPVVVESASTTASSTNATEEDVSEDGVVFAESRQWQIASDATGNMIIFYEGSSMPSADWSCLSCGSGTFFQRFVVGSSTYASTSGATTHTHTVTGSVLGSGDAAVSEPAPPAGTIAHYSSHGHTMTPAVDSASNLPAYTQVKVIQYTTDPGEAPQLPTGAIGMFDVASSSLPTGWYRYDPLDGRYPYGEDTVGTTGGSNTHTHDVNGTSSAASGSGERSRGGAVPAATLDHVHTVGTTTGATSNEPPYVEVLFARLSATATAPTGLISMWTDEVPTGYLDLSSSPSGAFYNKFPKGSATYGSTGGSATHNHGDMTGITSSQPDAGSISTVRSAGSNTGADDTHTHSVSLTDFTTASNLPPYITAIFGKNQGTNPVYQQLDYRWYANDTSNQTPTDPWPSGGTLDLDENEPITATSTPVELGDVLRLRMNAVVTNASATAGTAYGLQYGEGETCSAVSAWYDVGTSASTTALWRGFDNTVSDHSTLASTTLASTTVGETYEENGYATSTPNEIGVNAIGEWDFVIQHNDALPGTYYCFRMVEEDGTVFSTYADYPLLYTNEAPQAPSLYLLFDNEKTASTTPWFEFSAVDTEGDSVHYQIQVATDTTFGSTVINKNTISNSSQFTNLVLESDKAPYDQGARMRFESQTALTDGTTYYWRVRAQDNVSSVYGDWSSVQSFTIDTSLTVSAWYQTEEEQFDTNTLTGLETPSADYVSLISGSTTGTMIGTSMDFDDGSLGSAWGEFSFVETDPSGVINYQIQYLTDASEWALIPDSDLSGNSTGLTATTSLLDLDTDTYNEIRAVANFTGSAGSPQISSWTIALGYRVETPTLRTLFPNEKVGTTTPSFTFYTTDPQSDSLTYEISWSLDNTFTSSTTRNSSSSAGFVNADNGGDTEPFDSGDTIRFTMQPADALIDGSTYWWRVRAKDTTGADVYSLWSDAQSFTASSGVAASTWFQTTEEQFDSDVLAGTDALAIDEVTVATSATEAMIIYGESTDSAPKYRLWDGSALGTQGDMQDIGAPVRWAVVKAGETREEYVAATIGTDADVNVQVYEAGAWGDLQELTTSVSNITARGVDIAYESQSGDAMVAYCDGDADPSYYIWNGTSWSAGITLDIAEASNCEWIQLASDPTSDEIILVTRGADGNPYTALVWDGSTWGSTTTLGSVSETDHEGMTVEYEESGGQALVVVSDGAPNRFRYDSWNGSAWAGAATFSLGGDFEWGDLVRDKGSDEMALCLVDDAEDIAVARWSGSAWTLDDNLETVSSKTEAGFACVFEDTSGNDTDILLTYADGSNTNYQIYTTSWSAETQVNSITTSATMELIRTGVADILGIFFDGANTDLLFSVWDGSSWSTTDTLESDTSVTSAPFGKPYSMSPRNASTDGTVIVAPGINFTDGAGPYWDQFSWNESVPGTSQILYYVQYYDGDSWEFIPNADLAGNESGFSSGPVDLTGLNKNTYNQIRPYAALTCQDADTCPSILDWTVTWAQGITVSGTLQEADQSTNVNTGTSTIAVAVNGSLLSGKTSGVVNGVWSIGNVNTTAGDIVTVFVDNTSNNTEAVGVTMYDGIGDITGFQLFEEHLSLGSNDATSTALTNADVAVFHSGIDDDAFIGLSGSTLNVCNKTGCENAELYINASTTFTPGGNVVTHDFENNGTFIATSTVYVSGSWDNNATTTLTNSTVVFTATASSETVDETGAVTPVFNNLTFGTTTGNATWTLVTSLDVNNDLSVSRGTLVRGSLPITIAGSLSTGANGSWNGIGTTTFDGSGTDTWSDAHSTGNEQNIGNVVVDGTSKAILLGGNVAAESITIGANDSLNAAGGNYDITVYGRWVNNGTFIPQSGTVFFAATSSTFSIDPGGDAFYDMYFNGVGGGWSFAETNLTVNNDFTIATGTVTMPTATTSIAGSFSAAGGIFMHSNAEIDFTGSGSHTIAASSSVLYNAFYDLHFSGSGSWTFLDINASSSHDVIVEQGSVTFPSGTFLIEGSLRDTGGSFSGNGGTVVLTSTGAETITAGGSSFANLQTIGSGSWTFSDTNATILGDLILDAGTLTLPSGVLSLGGSLTNNASFVNSSGQITFNSTDTGETINPGTDNFYDVVFNSGTGGWTITNNATATNNFTLTDVSDFTLSSGQMLTVNATFTNAVSGASTTWSGSTLYLNSGTDYEINTKTTIGDVYGTLLIGANTDISMWNSSSTVYSVDPTGSLYSQDHSSVDGDLYIFSEYTRATGTEYWSYATDFDGTDLSGGSERQVNVYFGSGATAAITTATLEVVGDPSASTTIQNQGSGTYEVAVGAGTTTVQYYDFSDLGATGLSLVTGTIVTSLRDGAYTGAANGGALLTVDNTTIDANAAKQIYNVSFSTTTAILVSNVSQIGGAPSSYWWFRNSYGNADGEALDNDTGNPGSIRWDDSALNVTISGTIYTDDGNSALVGGTCDDGGTNPVRVVVEGGGTYDGFCNSANGTYSVGGVVIVGDPVITVFLNGATGGEKAVGVTKTVTADVNDFDLYVNRVITRHEDTEVMTTADLAVYDADDDADIQFRAATSTLEDTLDVFAGNELHIWATTTFTPGGPVTLHGNAGANTYDGTLHIGADATFTGAGTTTYTIAGSIDVEAGGTFIPASSTVVMNATTTGKTIDAAAGETINFNELQFTGAGGGWNINANASTTDDIYVADGTVTGTGDITLENGSFYGNGLVSLGGGYVVIEKSNTLGGTQGWTFNDLILGTGAVVGTTTPGSTATTTIGGTLTIGTAHFLDAGSSVFDLSGVGTVFVENGTFLEDTSTVVYSGDAATNVLSTEYYNLTFDADSSSPTFTVVGSGVQVFGDLVVGPDAATTVTFDTNDAALNVDGDMTIGANGTFVASDSSSFTLAGSYDNNGTFTGSSGTITFDGAGTHTIAAGNSSFSNLTVNGTGDFTVTEHATATGAWTLTAANDFTVSSGVVLAVGGTFTNSVGGADTIWTGSTLSLYGGGNYEINASTTSDVYGTLAVGADTQIRMWNSSSSVISVDSTGSLYSMDHDDVAGDLYIYGAYEKTSGTDYWSYATDFDGSTLGSPRKADVYVAGSGSVSYIGGGLIVAGQNSASTTIQNQGSGSYTFTLGGNASTTWTYYEVRDTDSSGLIITGSPTINSINYGDFLVSANGGSAITIGGMALNNNPAKTFTDIKFASSSGVLAYNVTATGTAVSSWRFTNHYGNIDGEGFDIDPDGDPGYLAWDDSAALITIAGTVYQDDEVTVSTACPGATIRVRVAGLTTYDGSCDGSGDYSVNNIAYSSGDSIAVYISGEVENAVAVTADPVSNINNMDLYENTVIVRHESADPITIVDMSAWDSVDDGDVIFTAVDSTPDTLTLPDDTRLVIWQDKEFAPGGNITLSDGGTETYRGDLEMQSGATFTAASGESHSIGGSLISDAGATFDANTSTVTFTSTQSETIDINDGSFYDVDFTGSGSWAIADTTFDVNSYTQSAGSVTLPTGTTTVSDAWTVTGGSFTHNGSTMVFDGSGAGLVVQFGGSDVAELQFTGSGSWSMDDTNATSTGGMNVYDGTVTLPSGTLTLGGDFSNTSGAVTHNSGNIILATTTTASLLASTSDLYSVTFRNGGTFTMEDVSASLLGSFTIESGAVTLGTGTLSVGGSFDATGGTFDHSTGTILFNSADTGETINPGSNDFYNINIAGASGGWTITGDATTTNNFTLSSASSFTLGSGNTLTVEGVFTNSVGGSATVWDGSVLNLQNASEYAINSKSAGGDDYQTIVIGANADISAWNSQATTTTVQSGSSFYSQDHAGSDGALNIYGDYHIATTTEYWSYATDFDGTDLTGGSERAVTVSFASGATTTLDSATLNIVGVSGNETTITNQGSGVYALRVLGGTFNSQYAQYRNLNSNGLVLSGTPVISSLNYSDFELAVNGGSLISLGSTTLNANASFIITGARFATTTAITGYNVNLSGTTPSAWTFVSHTGNLDGESFDVDGISACGQVRWDDSSCLLTQQTHYRWRNNDGGIGVPADEWMDTDWNARKRVRLVNSDNTTYATPTIQLLVQYDSDMQADFDDLRFTDSSGTTSIPYFIASSTNSASAEVWVQVPSLTAQDTTNIFMYYNNSLASSESSSTQAFAAADDFEDNNISEYTGANDDKNEFSVSGSFAFGGSYGLDPSDLGQTDDGGMAVFDQTVQQGQIIRYMQYVDTSVGDDEVCTLFGVQSPISNNQNYAVCIEQVTGTDRISLSQDVVDVDTSGTIMASTSVTYSTGWYEVEIDWQTDDTIDVSLYDDSGSLVATISSTTSAYSSGGYGFAYWYNRGGYDNFTSRNRVVTEPTAYFGAEVTDGGATWGSETDSTAADFTVGETARVRFAIENTGLTVTDAYELEFAEQGASPSCEAVSPASYSTVSPFASCGSDPVCMATSSFVTNGAATADLLDGPDAIDFIAGEFVEDTSNITSSLTVDQYEYTEVEYAVVTNANVSDVNLCFRVTDSGSDLDTYLRVAKMAVRFDPSFGAVSFNNGQPISLIGGTTTRVYATSTVTDLNGYSDIVAATSTFYRTLVTAACADDPNNCYTETTDTSCSFTNCAGNSCVLECYADMYYLADPTDSGSAYEGEEWFAWLEVEDNQNGIDFGTSPGIELLTLRSLEVDELIDYGDLEVYQDTGSDNASTTVTNEGNEPIDVQIVGADLSDGLTSTITADQQIFATSTFTYSSCTVCTTASTTAVNYQLDLSKPTNIAAPVTDEIYWGIYVPFGTKSNPHSGTNQFIAIPDS